ncbi:MAG: hypothetical protein JO265_00635 [Acidimicrobiia bacterium]|nr:hypothetical protein [Acidimicrobiia bacterium]
MTNGATLENARQLAGITLADLWLRYFTLGGTATESELGRFLRGDMQFGDGQHDVVAHALNERFDDLDMDHPVPYVRDA